MEGATARLGCTWDLILNKCKNHSCAVAAAAAAARYSYKSPGSYKGPGLSTKDSHIGDSKAKVEI